MFNCRRCALYTTPNSPFSPQRVLLSEGKVKYAITFSNCVYHTDLITGDDGPCVLTQKICYAWGWAFEMCENKMLEWVRDLSKQYPSDVLYATQLFIANDYNNSLTYSSACTYY